LELAEEVVELVESDVPGALEGAHPIVDGFERRAVHAIPSMSSLGADEHETHGAQHAKVFRDLRLAQSKPIDEIADRRLSGAECTEEVASASVGYGVECVGGGEWRGHGSIIFRYRNMSRVVISEPTFVIPSDGGHPERRSSDAVIRA
jgi:hypothetical protein